MSYHTRVEPSDHLRSLSVLRSSQSRWHRPPKPVRLQRIGNDRGHPAVLTRAITCRRTGRRRYFSPRCACLTRRLQTALRENKQMLPSSSQSVFGSMLGMYVPRGGQADVVVALEMKGPEGEHEIAPPIFDASSKSKSGYLWYCHGTYDSNAVCVNTNFKYSTILTEFGVRPAWRRKYQPIPGPRLREQPRSVRCSPTLGPITSHTSMYIRPSSKVWGRMYNPSASAPSGLYTQ